MMSRKLMMSVITATALIGVLSYGLAAAGQGPAPKGLDAAELGRVGVQLTIPVSAPKLTEAQVREATAKVLPVLMKEASGVIIRRVMYGPGTQAKQPAWLVSLDGLNIASSGPQGMAKTFNSQMHLILDDNGQPIISYTHQ
jgi:hypothetical protein